MPDTNTPVAAIPVLSALQFQLKWLQRFADNDFEKISPADIREWVQDSVQTFTSFFGITARDVRGVTYPINYTDQLGTIPPGSLYIGMQAVATQGVDSATGGAGLTADPVYYQLLKFSTGTVNALLSMSSEYDPDNPTAGTVKAHWVRVSGSEEDKIASFPVLELEDHDYLKGEVVQHTFPNGQTLLVEWRANSVGYVHPVPTGEDNDPIYKPFAPLRATGGGGASTFSELTDDPLKNALLAALFNAKAPIASPAFTGTPSGPTAPNGTNTTQLATTAFVQAMKLLLLDGVPAAGDSLQKLYNLIQLRSRQENVTTIAARNALNVTVGTWVNVDDDGDGKWAIYRATSAGVNATYNKVSDPDLLNAAMSAAQIKAAYESNPGVATFTTAEKSKLASIDVSFDPVKLATTDAARAYADVVLVQRASLASLQYLYNSSGCSFQAIKPDQTVWGAITTSLSQINADLATAFASTPAAVILRLQPTRVVTTEVAHTLLTFQLY